MPNFYPRGNNNASENLKCQLVVKQTLYKTLLAIFENLKCQSVVEQSLYKTLPAFFENLLTCCNIL